MFQPEVEFGFLSSCPSLLVETSYYLRCFNCGGGGQGFVCCLISYNVPVFCFRLYSLLVNIEQTRAFT